MLIGSLAIWAIEILLIVFKESFHFHALSSLELQKDSF
jgi:hypothetical protein